MTRISALDVIDVRFPTSRRSGRLRRDEPRARLLRRLLVLRTDDPAVNGCSLLFTTGRGNEVACAATRSLAPYVVGLEVAELVADIGTLARVLTWDGQLRWLGPEKGVMHMAIGAVVNAAWDLRARLVGQPLWQCALGRSRRRSSWPRSTSPTSTTPSLRRRRSRSFGPRPADGQSGSRCWRPRGSRRTRRRRAGSATTMTKVERLARQVRRRWVHDAQAQGRRRRRPPTCAGSAWLGSRWVRGRASPSTPTRRWGVQQAIEWMGKLAEFDPYWIEEPTSPDDVLGHRTIRQALRPVRVATGEHVQNRVIFKQLLQAEAIDVVQIDACRVGGVNENLAILLLAAKFGIPVCPHAGGVGLCEMVQHLAMFDFVAVERLARRPVDRVRRPPARALQSTRSWWRVVGTGCRTEPGGGAQLLDASIAEFRYPDGPAWTGLASCQPTCHHGSTLTTTCGTWPCATSHGSPARPWRPLRRGFGVAELAAATAAGGFTHTVVVQTVADVAETEELLDLAAADTARSAASSAMSTSAGRRWVSNWTACGPEPEATASSASAAWRRTSLTPIGSRGRPWWPGCGRWRLEGSSTTF